jgi:hypothetical protein
MDYLERTNNGRSFSGSDVGIFQAITIASALKLYARTGMKASRAYTPSAMMKAAATITGQTFKARDYMGAADALHAWADAAKAAPRTEG